MTLYDKHIFPTLMDFACGLAPVRRQREMIVPLARGRVLEVGIGTGLNLPYYDNNNVEKIWGLDPALEMHRRAAERVARSGLEVELIGLSGERVPMDEDTFDTVVVTYTLCSIPDVMQALREMRRVLKPGGQLVFCEHGRAPDAVMSRWQDRLTPMWRHFAGGCHLNRPIPDLIRQAGFKPRHIDSRYLTGFKSVGFNYRGVAIPIK
jgi:ubiquinone/menaquinone biosynthesis C-methylase UbiE